MTGGALTATQLIKPLCAVRSDGGFCDGVYPGSGARSLRHGATTLLFYGNDGVHGFEPWRTDGTPEGTFMLADLNPGPASSGWGGERFLSMFNREYVVAKSAPDGGDQLWELLADGGAGKCRDAPGGGRFLPSDAGVFYLGDELWKVTLSADGGEPEYAKTAVSLAGYTALRGFEVIGDRVYTVGSRPPSLSRQVLELSGSEVRSIDSEFYGRYSPDNRSDDWLSLEGSSSSQLFLQTERFAKPEKQLFSLVPGESRRPIGTALSLQRSAGTFVGPAMHRGFLFATQDGDAGLRLAIGSAGATTLLEPRGCTAIYPVQVDPYVALVGCAGNGDRSTLWRTDGLASLELTDSEESPSAWHVGRLQPLEPEGLTLLRSGVGWTLTDGTVAGTRVANAKVSEFIGRVGERVVFSARLNDPNTGRAVSGYELFSMTVDQLLDTTPPTISCPGPITLVRRPDAGSVTLDYPPITASDDRTVAPEIVNPYPPGFEYPSVHIAGLNFGVSARDLAGNASGCELQFTFVDEGGGADTSSHARDGGTSVPVSRGSAAPQASGCGCVALSTESACWLMGALFMTVQRRRVRRDSRR